MPELADLRELSYGRYMNNAEFAAVCEQDGRRRRWIDTGDSTVQTARAAYAEFEAPQGRETRKRARGRSRQPKPTPDEEAHLVEAIATPANPTDLSHLPLPDRGRQGSR